jgi:hypothetical protein
MEVVQESLATLEQAAERRVRQSYGLAGTFLRPVFLQHGAGELILVGEVAAIQTQFLDNVVAEGPLQSGIVVAGRRGEIGLMFVPGEVDRKPPLEMASEEELPLGVGCPGDAVRQHVSKRLRFLRRRKCAAALADDAHHGAAVADVIVKLLERGIASWFLSEVALHPQQSFAGAQISSHGIARLAELAGDGREEDAKFIWRHGNDPKQRYDFGGYWANIQ